MKHLRTAVPASLAAVALMAAAPAATAQNSIPGDNSPGTTFVTDQSLGTVTVGAAGAGATGITWSLVNRTGYSLTCKEQPNDTNGASNTNRAGMVTEATVAQKTLAYYANYQWKEDPNYTINFAISGSSFAIPLHFGGIVDLLPGGSAASAFGDAFAAGADIGADQDNARQRGHTGEITSFTVNNGATAGATTALIAPSAGPTTDFDAAVVLFCNNSSAGRNYVFVGYETGTTPPTPDPRGVLATGSISRK